MLANKRLLKQIAWFYYDLIDLILQWTTHQNLRKMLAFNQTNRIFECMFIE